MARRLGAACGIGALVVGLVVWGVHAATGSVGLTIAAIAALVAVTTAIGVVSGKGLARSYGVLVRRDQAVSVAASHELRTPITALRLSLEDLTLWPSTPTEVGDELGRVIGELDRLTEAVTRLLDQNREHLRDGAEEVDVSGVTTEAVERWSTTIGPSRAVSVDAPLPARVRIDTSTLGRVLATQLDQFDGDGAGDVAVEVAGLGRTVRVRVVDQSPPRFVPGVVHGPTTGKGPGEQLTLEEAGGLAESVGGYLVVEEAPTTCVSLILPAAPGAHLQPAPQP